MRNESVGKAAYEIWRQLLPTPNHMEEWDKLPLSAKEGWIEIALAAIDQHIADGEE